MIAIFDIECNGLYEDATTIHCIAVKCDDEPTQLFTSKDGNIGDAIKLLNMSDLVVAHNGINFDLPVLAKLGFPVVTEAHDTLIISKLKFPNIMLSDANRKTIPPKLKGRHSLKAWGYRLRKLKGEYGETADWSTYSDEMGDYCVQDVEVTYELYKLLKEKGLPPAEAIRLEQEFARVISRQEKYGVYFDLNKAQKLHIELMEEAERAEEELFKVFTPLKDWVPVKEVPQFTKSGAESKTYLNQVAKGCHHNDNLEWGFYREVVFNPTSRQHIARWLSEVYGWEPTEFTDKDNIVINEEVLDSLEFPEGKILAHYFNVKKLLGQLVDGKNAWMKMLGKDGRIHGRVDTLGAVSRRCTHSQPNMAQVPSSRAYKGHEARELFRAPEGKKLVGCDADALELRTLSHYMARFDDGAYATAVDKGNKDDGTDIHTLNQKGAGLPTRDDAKTFIYAFLYGAGDAKIGSIINGSSAQGKKLKDKFFKQIPAIKSLVDAVALKVTKSKTLLALDGNPYHIRSSHSALNTLLQGAGALVMKYYLIELDKNLTNQSLTNSSTSTDPDYEFVLNVHDEVQIECKEHLAEKVAAIAVSSFDDVTKLLDFRIPLRGQAAIGDSWADTH